jgi:hypothetical protein
MYEAKINYLKQLENGSIAKKNESYLVEAHTFTEAEANLQKVLQPVISEYELKALKQVKFTDCILNYEADNVYHVKAVLKDVDPDTGKEKAITENYYVMSDNVEAARKSVDERLKGSIGDWHISSIRETKILDIFTYDVINA